MTDAHSPDAQAGYEKVFTSLIHALVGLNFISGFGLIGTENTFSLEQLIIDNEIANYTKRIIEGINVSDEKIAADLIMNVGPGGSFLSEEHTLQHFREELWDATISQRHSSYEDWELNGKKDMRQVAHEKVNEILATHRPEPLDKKVEAEIWNIVKRADDKYL